MIHSYLGRIVNIIACILIFFIAGCSSDIEFNDISKIASTLSMSDALKSASEQRLCGRVAAMIYWEDEDSEYDKFSFIHFKAFNGVAFGFGFKSAVPEALICQVALADVNKQLQGQSKRQVWGIDYKPKWPITVDEIHQRCIEGKISDEAYQSWWKKILDHSKSIELIWNDSPILNRDTANWISNRIDNNPDEKLAILKEYYLSRCI